MSSSARGKRVSVRPATADDGEDGGALSQQTFNDDEQRPKQVLIARRPLLQQHRLPSVEVDTERQSVVVVRQSPRLLPRQREQADDDEPQQQQVIVRQQPSGRASQQQRLKEQSQQQQQKEPTAQTIRNYNKLNDDGSFTFGYEADDGSFKEETRGTDCVVRGKYGYVDPDGNKREFSYVQGNPCDPNAVEDDEEQPSGKPAAEEEENVPNIPVANVARPKPKKTRPTTTLFQQTFGDFEQPQLQPSTTARQPGNRQQQPLHDVSRRPSTISPPPSSTAAAAPPPPPPPQFRPFPPTPAAAADEDLETAIRNLPQPSGKSSLIPSGPNSPLYTTELVFDPATGQYNTVIFQQVPKQSAAAGTAAEAPIEIRQRLPLAPAPRQPQPQPQPAFQPHAPPQFGAPPQFRAALQPFQFQSQRPAEFDFQRPATQQQQLVQQQQALTFQQSQNLFRQQQKQQQQQQLVQQPFQPQSAQFFPPPPPPSQRFATEPQQFAPSAKPQRLEQQPEAHQQRFVLVQPGRTPGQQSLAAGQIDAFLRGHNVQF